MLLATCMADPAVLILDEPTNELDPLRRRILWTHLRHLKEQGTTIVLTTHNLIEAEQVVERVAVINRGKLVALGTPGELKRGMADQVLREGQSGQALATVTGSREVQTGRWEIVMPSEEASQLLARTVEAVGIEAIDDFRLVTPSLEDVYVHLTSQRWEDDHAG